MPLTSLAANGWPPPPDPRAALWIERFDTLLADALAGADPRTLYPSLVALFDIIASGSAAGSARDLLLAQRVQMRRAARNLDHGLVAGNLLFLHDWLSRALAPAPRARAAA